MQAALFTIQQIEQAHARVQSGADFPQYIRDIRALGVQAFDTYVTDSHTEYEGAGGYRTTSNGQYAALTIAAQGAPAAWSKP